MVSISRSVLSATNDWLAKNEDVARRFVAALQKSLQWGIDNLRKTAELTVQRYSELDVDQIEAEWKAVIPLVRNADTEEHGLAWANAETFNNAVTFMAGKGWLPRVVPAEEALTNEYLPKH